MLGKNNQKGFTLVELLAVIMILGIILAIAVPAVGNIVKTSEEKAHKANVLLVENAARLASISVNDGKEYYSIEFLVKEGFLDQKPTNIKDIEYRDGDHITINSLGGRYFAFRADDKDDYEIRTVRRGN